MWAAGSKVGANGAKGGAEHGSEWRPDGSVVGAKRGFKAGLDGTKLGSVIGPNTVMNHRHRQRVAPGIHRFKNSRYYKRRRKSSDSQQGRK